MNRPPAFAEWITARLLRPDEREAVLGDLHEEYLAMCEQYGDRHARRWYWRQTWASAIPDLRRRFQRLDSGNEVNVRGFMDTLLFDIRYGVRTLIRRPLLTVVALASLIVGIAFPSVVFGLLDAVMLRPLPVSEPDQLVVLLNPREDSVNHNFSYPDFVDYRAAQRTLTDLAAYSRSDVTMRTTGGSEVVAAELVSGGYFQTLGVAARYGRTLTDEDDRSGAAPVAVVSLGLWRRISGAATTFEPRAITLNAQVFSIVGVLAAPFRGMEIGREVRVWAPLHQQPTLDPSGGNDYLPKRTSSWLTVIGRLRSGVGLERAAADLNAVEGDVARRAGRPRPMVLALTSGRLGDSMLPQATGSPLRVLLGAALLVLIVACANVANLLVTRATERSHEIAVRAALGARRGRLVRQVMIETLLLGVVGAAAALVVSVWLASWTVPLMSSFGEPITLDVSVDWRMVAFVTCLALAATVAAGVAPALFVRRSKPAAALGEAGRALTGGRSTTRLRQVLVIVQFALSLALIAGAILLARTVHNLKTLSTGFDIDHVALVAVDPEAAQYSDPQIRAYYARAIERLGQIPGVNAVGYGRVIPLGFGGSRTTIAIGGYQAAPNEDMDINFNRVSPGYFAAMGIGLIDGRLFDARDAAGAPQTLVVNETMAAHYWPKRGAVGQHVRFSRTGPDSEVIGVVRDVKYRMLREDAAPSFYLAQAQEAAAAGVLHVRTEGDPRILLDALRRAIAEMDPAVPVVTVRTLREQATLNVNDERVAMLIGVTLAGAALLLAAVGLYGSIAYTIGQRQREIGVRMALGATAADIRRLVLGQGLTLSLAGTLIGAALALGTTRLLQNRLFGVASSDLPTLVAGAALLSVVAAIASLTPAWRAARVDPVRALRVD